MGEAAKLFTRSLMMGLDSAVRKPEFAEPTAEDIENMPYHEAVEFLKKRDVIKKVDYDKLSDKMKFRAFTASRINDGKLLEKLNAQMLSNVNGGKGLKDFLSLTKTDILDKIGMGPNQGWYWETVYRTNVQTAYNVGRAMGFEADKPLALQFVGIDDARQTDVCHSLSGVVRPYDDPFWQSHFPPLHFNCRSTIRAIYDEDELPEEWSGLDEAESPAKGFGSYPLDSDNWWKELDSQVRQAKQFGVQEEIEAAKEMLINKNIDKTEKVGIIKLKINLFDSSDDIYKDAFAIEDEAGFEDVYLHGDSQFVQVKQSGKVINLNASDFAAYLKNHGYKGGNIRLASCSTGRGDNSFAQQLSKELSITVKAPDDDVYFIPEDGALRIGSPYANLGNWRIFCNGVELK